MGLDFFRQQLKLSYTLKIGYGRVKKVVLLMVMMYIPMKMMRDLREDTRMSVNKELKEINGYRRCSELVFYICMNRKGRRSSTPCPRLEDVPELLQHIQSWLPLEEATRTSVLSKSWLQAWSTIPTLRFYVLSEHEIIKQMTLKRKHMKLVDVERTLIRYLRDNLQIEKFNLKIDIDNQESASLAEKWIQSVATKSCLKELSLNIRLLGASLRLPDEILSGENLTKIRVSASSTMVIHSDSMKTSHHPKCVSLRELHLHDVLISEEVLHDILSSCNLLEEIHLVRCSGDLNAIRIKNLPCLYHLHIVTNDGGSTALEINHVPILRVFTCNVIMHGRSKRPLINAHSISLGSNVTKLTLCSGVFIDNASLDMMINSGLHCLESLTLDLTCWTSKTFYFTSASIKRFSLLDCPQLVDVVHVTAPKLLFWTFKGEMMPRLLFPDSTLEEIEFQLRITIPRLSASFFLNMRKAVALATKCNIHIDISYKNHDLQPFEIDIDDLRARLPFPPAINVVVYLRTNGDECLWERSAFFDAFFEICHPIRTYIQVQTRSSNTRITFAG
ncbi:unnamed protein product [Lactuca saligna]|uniref:F-box/LRR-repeat protein 15/At3g58940/PEG3-like LRR domain-containing protein n=1 Tax=Lactuca saligna TaxID=75948 RepID=A0AA35Z303_LACSI|nr:unnamed protein product [Lactuca saligna]